MGEALAYTIPRWDNLMVYLYGGTLEIDINLVENAIRPNALGRKSANRRMPDPINLLKELPCSILFLEPAKETTLILSTGSKMGLKEYHNTRQTGWMNYYLKTGNQ